jgi:acetate kinase
MDCGPCSCRGSSSLKFGLYRADSSCESIMRQIATELPDRVIVAHLGNGASVSAVKAGRSIDTSMGLNPTGGVIVGTRSDDLDPDVLVYLMREKKFDAAIPEELVDRRSCLLGISCVVSDVRRLHAVPLQRTPMRDLPSECSAIPCASRWLR